MIVLSWLEFWVIVGLSALFGAGVFAFRLWLGQQLGTPWLDEALPVVKRDLEHVRHQELDERVERRREEDTLARRSETRRLYPLPAGRKDGAA